METSEILVAFASSLAGAVVGAVLPLFLPKRGGNGQTGNAGGTGGPGGPGQTGNSGGTGQTGQTGGNTISGGRFDGPVHVGNRTFDVTQDNRVIINSTTVREVVQSSPSRRAERRDAPRDGSTTGDDYTPFVLAGIAALLVMVGYLRYRDAVTLTVLSVSGFAMFLPIGALVVARVRAVSYARSQLAQVWINVLLVCASLVSIYFLSHPAAGFDSAEFAALLEAGERRASLRELFERFGIDWALFLAYQLMGLAVSVLTVAAIALHSLKLYAVAAAAVRARSDATYQPGPVRAWLIRAGGSPGQVFRRAIVLAVLSIVLISGAGYALVTKLQGDVEFPLPSTPTTPSTVSPPPAVPPADPSPVPGPAT